MWDSEMVTLLRHVIDDLAEEPKYTDSRLRQLLLVAAQLAQAENNLIQEYVINIDNQTIKPDPTSTKLGMRDDSFVNLIILKAACLLASSGLLKASKTTGSYRENNVSFDTKGKFDSQNQLTKT